MKVEIELTPESVGDIVLKDLQMCLEFAKEDKDVDMISALNTVIKLYTIPSELKEDGEYSSIIGGKSASGVLSEFLNRDK